MSDGVITAENIGTRHRLGVIDDGFAIPVAESAYRLAAELPQETTP